MTSQIKSVDEIVDDLKGAYRYHLTELRKAESLLKTIGVSMEEVKPQEVVNQQAKNKGAKKAAKSYIPSKRVTFGTIAFEVLSDGYPKRAIDIAPIIKEKTGREIERRDVASRLNQVKGVSAYAYEDAPKQEYKFWWVLDSWLEGNELKPVYLERIKEKIKESAVND